MANVEDLDAAISIQTKAVDLMPDGHPDKPMYLNNLGISRRHRFGHLGNVDDPG